MRRRPAAADWEAGITLAAQCSRKQKIADTCSASWQNCEGRCKRPAFGSCSNGLLLWMIGLFPSASLFRSRHVEDQRTNNFRTCGIGILDTREEMADGVLLYPRTPFAIG